MYLILMGGQAQSAVQVYAQIDRSMPIFTDSTFSYSIIVANGGRPEKVDISALELYSPAGPSTQSRSSIVNGKSSTYQILSYQMTAPSAGQHTIPSVKVLVGGKEYQTTPIKISVFKPGTKKKIEVRTNLSSQTCYVGQPIVFNMSFTVWKGIVEAEQITNINIHIPFLKDDQFYMEDVDAASQDLTKIALRVNGQKEYVYQDQVRHQGVDCIRIQFIKILIPQNAGSMQLEPASVIADLAVGRRQTRGFFGAQYEYEFKQFSFRSESLPFEVRAIPQSGKPVDFYGLVGNYTISADATPKEVNVGDPVTLTIHIGGSQYLKPVQWPDLETIPKMAESFKMPSERSDGEIQNNVKVFTQTIRPNHDDVTQVPPIPLSFFDVSTGQYRTVYTKPIPLQVSPTRIVTGDDVESRQLSTSRKQIEAIREGLSANYTSLDALVNQRFSPLIAMTGSAFIFLYIVPLIGLTGSAVVRYMMADSPQRQALGKRKKAYSHATTLIRNALDHEKPSQQVLLALKQYVADKFGKPAGSLTAIECKNIITENINDAELSSMYQAIMEQTEASEYSPMAFKLTKEKQKEIIRLLSKIEKKIK